MVFKTIQKNKELFAKKHNVFFLQLIDGKTGTNAAQTVKKNYDLGFRI
jgi:hypothetical protein